MTHSRTARYAFVLIVTMALAAAGLQPGQVDTAAAQTATFADGFQDENDTGWTRDSGTWDVVAGGTGGNLVYEQAATGPRVSGLSMIKDRTWADFHLKAQVKPLDLQDGDAVRVFFRYTNRDDHYLVYLTSRSIQLRRWAGGNLTTIDQESVSIDNGTSHWIDIEARGDHFNVHLDKVLKLSADDGRHASGGIGLGTWQTGAQFDAVTVSHVVRMGAAQSNLFWYAGGDREQQYGVLDAMKGSGVNRVRLNLAKPNQLNDVIDLARHADDQGLEVLLSIGLSGNAAYYPPGATPITRGNSELYRLSDLRPDEFGSALRGYLLDLRSAGVDLNALNIGNEVNWFGFNGDLPEITGGRIYGERPGDRELEWDDPDFKNFRQGVQNWGRAISVAQRAVDDIFQGSDVKIVTGGFADIPDRYVGNIGGSIVRPELLLQLLQGSHPNQPSTAPDYIANADYIGTHIYPYRPYNTDPAEGYESIKNHIGLVMDPVVAKIGTSTTFWIDEFGFRRSVTEQQRLQLFRWFMLALYDRSFVDITWGEVYVYNFIRPNETTPKEELLNVYEYGALLPPGLIFADYPD